MESKNISTEERIAEKLRNHTVAPPPQMWDNIQAKMVTDSNRQRPFWLLDAGVLLLWILLSIIAQQGALTPNGLETQMAIAPLSVGNTEAQEVQSAHHDSKRGAQSSSTEKENTVVSSLTQKSRILTSSANSTIAGTTAKGSSSTSVNRASDSEFVGQSERHSSSPLASLQSTSKVLVSNIPLAEVDVATVHSQRVMATQTTDANGFTFMDGKRAGSLPTFDYPDLAQLLEVTSKDKSSLAKTLRKHQFFLGISGMLNLSFIFNQNTRGAYGGRELPYLPTLGYAGAVRLGYRYKHHYGFETGFIFHSKQGQHYEGTIGNAVAARQVDLTYMQIPLVLRYSFGNVITKRIPAPWVVGIGAQLGILTSATEQFEGNEAPFKGEFVPTSDYSALISPLEVAGVFSIDKEIYFHKNMFVAVGLRATFGSDINAVGHPTPDDYGKSHNFILGLNVSINGCLGR